MVVAIARHSAANISYDPLPSRKEWQGDLPSICAQFIQNAVLSSRIYYAYINFSNATGAMSMQHYRRFVPTGSSRSAGYYLVSDSRAQECQVPRPIAALDSCLYGRRDPQGARHQAYSVALALAPQLRAEGRRGVLLNTLIELQHLVFGQTTILRLERQSIRQALFPGGNLLALIQVEQIHMPQ